MKQGKMSKMRHYGVSGKMPSCISWCASARQCLGEERWQQLMGKGENEICTSKAEDDKGKP